MDDDRERLTRRARGGILIVEDDPRFRRDPARPGARAGLPVRRDALRRTTRWRPRSRCRPDADHSRHEPARPFGARRCSTSSSATPRRVTSRCTSSRSPTSARKRSSRGAVGYALKPVKREQLVDGLPSTRSAGCRTGVRRVLVVEDDAASAREHAPAARRTAMSRSSASPPPREALDAAPEHTLRLHGAGPESARPAAATSCSRRWRERRTCSFPPVIVYTGRVADARRGAAAAPLLAARSSSRTRARPSACWTR